MADQHPDSATNFSAKPADYVAQGSAGRASGYSANISWSPLITSLSVAAVSLSSRFTNRSRSTLTELVQDDIPGPILKSRVNAPRIGPPARRHRGHDGGSRCSSSSSGDTMTHGRVARRTGTRRLILGQGQQLVPVDVGFVLGAALAIARVLSRVCRSPIRPTDYCFDPCRLLGSRHENRI
jgi:hypothetical protein